MLVPITVQRTGTADNLDVLTGSDLENVPGFGLLTLFGVATASDTTVTLIVPNVQSPARAFVLTPKAVATVNPNDDSSLTSVEVNASGRILVSVDITAASTWAILAVWQPYVDM